MAVLLPISNISSRRGGFASRGSRRGDGAHLGSRGGYHHDNNYNRETSGNQDNDNDAHFSSSLVSSSTDSGSSSHANTSSGSDSYRTINLVSNGHTWQMRVAGTMPLNDWMAMVRMHPDRNVATAEGFDVVDEQGVIISPLTTRDKETYYISLQPSTPVQQVATLGWFVWRAALILVCILLVGRSLGYKQEERQLGWASFVAGGKWVIIQLVIPYLIARYHSSIEHWFAQPFAADGAWLIEFVVFSALVATAYVTM